MSSHIPLVGTDATDSRPRPVAFEEAHRDGIPHRGVHVEIEDSRGRLLIAQRRDGRWEIPGGHVDWLLEQGRPESYEEAALRELVEELNLEHNWSVTAEVAKDRLRGQLVPLGRTINQTPSRHGKNNEWIAVYRLFWDIAEWSDPQSFVPGEETHTPPQWWEVPTLVDSCIREPHRVNSALRLFLARRGALLPLP